MKPIAYKHTDVAAEKSQRHIKILLYNYGATGIQFTEEFVENKIQMRFRYDLNGEGKKTIYMVRMEAQIRQPSRQPKTRDQRFRAREQGERAAWRAIFYALKSRMVSIDYGIETFEQAFLAHFEAGIDEHGHAVTIGERIIPRLREGQLALPEKGAT